MNEINFFDLNHHTNLDSKYFQKSDLVAKEICKSRWNDMTKEWIETCTDYPDSGNNNSGGSNGNNSGCWTDYSSKLYYWIEKCPNTKCSTSYDYGTGQLVKDCEPYKFNWRDHIRAGTTSGQIMGIVIILIFSTSFVIFFRVFNKKKGNTKKLKTNSKENYLNKTSGTKKLNNSNNFDLISFIEELKEDKYPDASILESYIKGSYVILKDLNGKTIAEIKIPE